MWSYIYLQARTVSLPAGRHGGALEARYRLRNQSGPTPAVVRVTEAIRVLHDPYNVASQFQSGPNNARNGFFNDIYRLVSRNPLPADFRFEVEQTYKANNQPVAGKNKIAYTNSSVLLYIWERNRWRLRGRGPVAHSQKKDPRDLSPAAASPRQKTDDSSDPRADCIGPLFHPGGWGRRSRSGAATVEGA